MEILKINYLDTIFHVNPDFPSRNFEILDRGRPFPQVLKIRIRRTGSSEFCHIFFTTKILSIICKNYQILTMNYSILIDFSFVLEIGNSIFQNSGKVHDFLNHIKIKTIISKPGSQCRGAMISQ